MSSGEAARPRRIAFGDFPPFEGNIRTHLQPRYAPSFGELATFDLGGFDAVIPMALEHYTPLGARPGLRGRKFFHPSPETVALCHDKLGLSRFLIDNGFGAIVPPLRAAGAPYPYIWKRRQGAWGRNCHIVDGPETQAAVEREAGDWFAQAFLPGAVEYATHILRTEGQVRYATTVTYEMSSPTLVLGQRNPPRAMRFTRDCPHLAVFEAVLARLDYEGSACIDYKVVDGGPMLFEINPRFGASLAFDINNYLDAYLGALRRDP